MRTTDILGAIGNTPLVELRAFSPGRRVRLFAKLEGHNPSGSIKDRIASRLIEEAVRERGLDRSKILLESTSGNTGIALAVVASLWGYQIQIVTAADVSPERKHLLCAYGAQLVLSPAAQGSDGALALAREMAAADRRFVLTRQYENPVNVRAMEESLGPELMREIPEMTTLVAAIGTGGTITGIARYARAQGKPLQVIGVEKKQGHRIPGLRNLAMDFNPPILDLSLIDRRLEVSAADAAAMTRQLAARAGILAGPSSGATLFAALEVADTLEEGNIVCIFPDGGWKYLSATWAPGSAELVQAAAAC